MKQFFYKLLSIFTTLTIIGTLTYFFRANLLDFKNRFYQQYLPCQTPITYQIGQFDKQFGISQKAFLASITEAEQIWEKPSGLNLFEYSPSGTVKINLIYDYRQNATVKLQQLGIVVKDDQATYDKLNADYVILQNSYPLDKANLDNQIAELDSRTATYNAEVTDINHRGGATPSQAQKLRDEETTLHQLLTAVQTKQTQFNNNVEKLNALADTLNRLAKTLNLSVARYNTVGGSQSSEFEEGTYVSSAAGQAINIYQFDSSQKLVRVLAHEFGHALGLEHVSSTKAIMYYLNNGVNEQLTPADILELKQHCGIK